MGLNQCQVVSALYKEIARTRKVPLSFDLNDARETDTQEKKAIDQFLKNRKKSNYKTLKLSEIIKSK
jgi:antitoxin component of RelBE/YafQ-DinJ toxin-antitoxin module